MKLGFDEPNPVMRAVGIAFGAIFGIIGGCIAIAGRSVRTRHGHRGARPLRRPDLVPPYGGLKY